MTTPTPNPQPVPVAVVLAAPLFIVAAIAAVVVFERKPDLFRLKEPTSASQHASSAPTT
jgi:hypothetical protein